MQSCGKTACHVVKGALMVESGEQVLFFKNICRWYNSTLETEENPLKSSWKQQEGYH